MTALLLAASLTAAVPPAALTKEAATAAADVDRHWYGWQTLLADAGTLGVFVIAVKADSSSNSALYLGAALFAAGGPAIHFSHGRGKTGALDLLLRIGVPVGGALTLGLATSAGSCADCFTAGAIVGFALGLVGASVLDATVLSWETTAPVAPVSPAVAFFKGRDGQQHAALALGGRF